MAGRAGLVADAATRRGIVDRWLLSAPALLIIAQGKDGPVYRVGFTNFYVITRYNRSPMYAMAVHDLGQAWQLSCQTDVRQSEFGIKPYSMLMGSMKVVDTVSVSFTAQRAKDD